MKMKLHKTLYTKIVKPGDFGTIRVLEKEPSYTLVGKVGYGLQKIKLVLSECKAEIKILRVLQQG